MIIKDGRRRLITVLLLLTFFLLLLPFPGGAQSLDDVAKLRQQVIQLYQQGRYKEAISFAEKEFAILEKYEKALGPDHPDFASNLGGLAGLYRDLGDYQKAEGFSKRSLAIKEKALGPNHPDVAESLSGLASLYQDLGDYRQADSLYKRSLAIQEKALSPNDPAVAINLNNLAELNYTLGDPTKAEPLLKRALAIAEEILGPYHPDVAANVNNLAELYRVFGDYKNAELLYKRALNIWANTLGPEHPHVGSGLNNMGFLYLDAGKLEEAYNIFKKRDVPAGMGKYYLIKKDYTQATQMFLLSLQRSKKIEPHLLIGDYIGLGLSYEGQGDYKRAKEHFQKAIDFIEAQWRTLSPQAKKNFMTGQAGAGFSRLEPYEGMVRVILKERGIDSGKDSLTIAERVKGRVFLEMLATRQLRGKSKEDEAVLKKDREFQELLLSLRKKIEVKEGLKTRASQEEINALKDELARKEKEYTAFIEEVKLTGSELSSLLTVDPLSPSRVQSLLDPATSLLEYFTTKEKVYAWLLTKDAIKVYEMDIKEKDLKNKLDDFLLTNISTRSIKVQPIITFAVGDEYKQKTTEKEREKNREKFLNVASELYQLIMAPFEKEIKTKNLIIVPHGVLHKVPFSTLIDGRRYMMEKYAISILPAASVLEHVVKKRKTEKERLLAFANPKTDFAPLEFAEIEGKIISKLFPKSEVYSGEKATETIAKNKASSFHIVHFATHGEFNERQPLQSGLLLAKDEENDGYLQVHEIFGMDLSAANLVTLSACETALAKIQGGDDLVGLSRGFIYAGTPSLLATLWKVDDPATARLMEYFYKNWEKGMSKPEALRQAQMDLKGIPQYRHPYYWAPFVMIGDWQ
jgi:CHAT domain-containing protein/Tfp pilus assembly protein PilF